MAGSTQSTPTERRSESKFSEFMRRCHDCGKATPNYRCPQCRDKHLNKHRADCCGVTGDEMYSVAL